MTNHIAAGIGPYIAAIGGKLVPVRTPPTGHPVHHYAIPGVRANLRLSVWLPDGTSITGPRVTVETEKGKESTYDLINSKRFSRLNREAVRLLLLPHLTDQQIDTPIDPTGLFSFSDE